MVRALLMRRGMKLSLHVAVAAMVLCGAAACAGSTSDNEGGTRRADDLSICFYDGGPCIDADIPDPSGMFEAGAPSAPTPPASPTWPDPDAGSRFGFDASSSFGFCTFDPKYATEYATALVSGAFKSCFTGCDPTECCYAGACVAQ